MPVFSEACIKYYHYVHKSINLENYCFKIEEFLDQCSDLIVFITRNADNHILSLAEKISAQKHCIKYDKMSTVPASERFKKHANESFM